MNSNAAIRALSALAQAHRLAMFRLMVQEGNNGLPAGEIGGRIGISATSTSFHLKELERAGLIKAKREGRFIRYALKTESVRGLLSFLIQGCCQGRLELCGDVIFSKETQSLGDASNE